MRVKARFIFCFPIIFFILGFWTSNFVSFHSDVGLESQEVINQIYKEATAISQEALINNGGVKDPNMISLGHGPKIRLWDYFGPNFNCISRERVGKIGDGGKWLCGVRTVLKKKSSCVVYSVGSKGEVSFEIGIEHKLPNCEIHIFDPTLTVVQRRNIDELLEKFYFHDVGLAGSDGEMRIKSRKILWTQRTKSVYQVQSLGTMMASLGHTWLDVLKIDIEGGEWKVFEEICKGVSNIPVTQIQIELHFMGDARTVLSFFKCMGEKGFRVFSVEPNYYGRTAENSKLMIEYSFIQVHQNGKIEWGTKSADS